MTLTLAFASASAQGLSMVEISEYLQMVDFIRAWLFARGRVILSHCYFFDVWVMKFHLAGQLTKPVLYSLILHLGMAEEAAFG